MDFNVDADFFFVFGLLFLGTMALFILAYFGLHYLVKSKTIKKREIRAEKKQENYKRIELKYAQLNISKLAEDKQKLQVNLKHDLEKILKSDEQKHDHLASFYSTFESIYPTFGDTLQKIVTDITASELKLCAFLRLNLSSKEISMLLNITPDSVNKARYRLRKKLDLNSKDDLIVFLSTI